MVYTINNWSIYYIKKTIRRYNKITLQLNMNITEVTNIHIGLGGYKGEFSPFAPKARTTPLT